MITTSSLDLGFLCSYPLISPKQLQPKACSQSERYALIRLFTLAFQTRVSNTKVVPDMNFLNQISVQGKTVTEIGPKQFSRDLALMPVFGWPSVTHLAQFDVEAQLFGLCLDCRGVAQQRDVAQAPLGDLGGGTQHTRVHRLGQDNVLEEQNARERLSGNCSLCEARHCPGGIHA